MTAFDNLPGLQPPASDERGGPADQNCRRRLAYVWNVQQAAQTYLFPAPVVDGSVNEWGAQSTFSTGERWLVQGAPAGNPYFWFPLPGLPAGRRIDAVDLYLKGPSVHAVSSGDQPEVKLYQLDSSQTASAIGSPGLDSTNVAGYIVPHTISVGGLVGSDFLLSSSQYYLRVRGEGGSGVSGLQVWGARIVLTDQRYVVPT